MLTKSARLTSPNDFARTTKSGLRVTTSHFVGYLYRHNDASQKSAKVGLIIGKKVGNSVVRHRLARQIRHALAIENFPTNSFLVIRALGTNDAHYTIDIQSEIAELSRKLISKAEKLEVGVK